MPSTLKSQHWAAVFCTAAVVLTSAAFADDEPGSWEDQYCLP